MQCEFDGEYGSAKNSALLWNKVESVSGQEERSIEFIEPCMEVQWVDNLKMHGKFIINKDSADTLDILVCRLDDRLLYLRYQMAMNLPCAIHGSTDYLPYSEALSPITT